MPNHLFLYGTLHPDRAPAEIASAARRLTSIGRGTIRARLYNLGDYPAASLAPVGPGVPGGVFLGPDATTLSALDAFEDYRPGSPTDSLFLRTITVVTFDDGSRKSCWVYVYNRDPR